MTTNKHIYYETQKQKGAIVWLLLLALVVISFSLILVKYNEWENIQNKFSQQDLIIMGSLISAMFVGLFFLFKNIRMETRVENNGISFRYPPFKNSFEKIDLAHISDFEVSEYSPLKEYGGWGYKKPGKPRNKNTAYSISGKTALKIKLKNGNIILLGTQRKDALIYALRTLKEENYNV